MEQILTSKKIVERNISIVKHINDKYVLFKEENKTTLDNGKPTVSSVYGVTTIEELMSVRGDNAVSQYIIIPNDPKKDRYFVILIPTEDLEKLKNGVIRLANYNFPYSVEKNVAGDDMVYALFCTYDFTLRDMDEKLIPLPINLNYIEGCLDNEHYDLDKVLEIIKANPSRFVTVDGGDASLIKIDNIPYYNADENKTKFIDCKYLPTDEEYNEFVYRSRDGYFSRYNKILDKWFSECKKEVTD